MRYYVQHGAGLGNLVVDALESDFPDCQIISQDDSSVMFDTVAEHKKVATLPYVKNAFAVLGSVFRNQIPGSVDQLTKMIRKRKLLVGQHRGVPFRIMVSIDGQLVGLPVSSRVQLETVIAEQIQGKFNPRGGRGVEYWIIGRREFDHLFICLRLTSTKKNTLRGSLNEDLATLLVKASKPHHNDTFIDPFAGSGAILLARLNFPHRKVIYSDIRLSAHRPELPRRLFASQHSEVLDEDALGLPSISDGSITAIVTDPPWGEHEELDVPYEKFAESMLASFDRILHPQRGTVVLLLSRRKVGVVVNAWNQSPLHLRDSHDILVNGHPATVLLGER